MTADAIAIVQCLFSVVWRLFTSWYIPGTNVTPAEIAIFLLVSVWIIRHISNLLGIGTTVDNDSFRR